MARLRRYFAPEQPQHVIQRGNNRQKWDDLPPDVADAVVAARVISIYTPGASHQMRDGHLKQSARVRDAFEGIGDVLTTVSASAAFESNCLAVTLVTAVRGPN